LVSVCRFAVDSEMILDNEPKLGPTPAEAIGGAIYAKTRGPEAMPELAPMATYMTLAPFVGAEEAYERAMEESDKW
jgi:hypothetical protein